MSNIRLTCRQATKLLLSRQDRHLPWRERMRLRLHLIVCKACPRVARQLDLMRSAMGKWARYAEDAGEGDRT
jgi:hypothetical protein